MNINERMATEATIHRNLTAMRNLRELLAAMADAFPALDFSEAEAVGFQNVRAEVAEELWRCVEEVWRTSAKLQAERSRDSKAEGEGRDESLPW